MYGLLLWLVWHRRDKGIDVARGDTIRLHTSPSTASQPGAKFAGLQAKQHALRNKIARYQQPLAIAEDQVKALSELIVSVEQGGPLRSIAGEAPLSVFGMASEAVNRLSLEADGPEWTHGHFAMPQSKVYGEGVGSYLDFDPEGSRPFLYGMRQEIGRMNLELQRVKGLDRNLNEELALLSRRVDEEAERVILDD